MSLSSYKITGDAVARSGVVAAPDKLTGTAAQNKAVFDRLVRETVSELFNGLIDALAGEDGAAEIGTSAISGVAGGDVQSVLGSIKTILDAKMATADAAAALSLKSDKSVTDLHIKSVALDAATGVFTFTREDGTYTAIDTALEKVATNWQYDADTQSLVLTLADGSTQTVPLSAFITETEFADSDQLAFSVSNHTVTATVKAGSITDTMLSSALIAQLQGYVSAAANSATNAAQSETAAELYRTQAAGSASTATTKASDASASAAAAAGSATTASTKAGEASASATAAASSANAADTSAENAEAWSVGKRDGTDVPSTDPTYHNNAKYWCDQAAVAAGGMQASTYDPQGTVAAAGGIPDYVSENGSKPVQTYVTLSATWSGTGPYTQVVSVPGATVNSEVSFRPNAAQLQQLIDDGVQALYIENDSGVFKAVAVGAAPSAAIKKMVAEITEVVPAPQPEVSLTPKSGVTYTNGISDLSDSELDEIAETISAAGATVTNATEELYFDYGDTHRHISIGDQISYTMDGASYPFRIMGFNHYDKSDGSGKAGILMQMVDCFKTTQKIKASMTTTDGWHNSDLRTWMNDTMLGYLPSATQSAIKQVNISTGKMVSDATLNTTADKLFLPAEVEVFGTTSYARARTNEGTWYAWYKANNTAANRVKKVNGSANRWWGRSPNDWYPSISASVFFYVGSGGYTTATNANISSGVAPCFCI